MTIDKEIKKKYNKTFEEILELFDKEGDKTNNEQIDYYINTQIYKLDLDKDEFKDELMNVAYYGLMKGLINHDFDLSSKKSGDRININYLVVWAKSLIGNHLYTTINYRNRYFYKNYIDENGDEKNIVEKLMKHEPIEEKNKKDYIKSMFNYTCLRPKEFIIIKLYYGLNDKQKTLNYREIGEILGTSKQRIEQFHKIAIEKLKDNLKDTCI